MQSGCLPRVAAVVEEHKPGPGVPGPELEPGAHLSPLNRVAARQRQGRAYFTACHPLHLTVRAIQWPRGERER